MTNLTYRSRTELHVFIEGSRTELVVRRQLPDVRSVAAENAAVGSDQERRLRLVPKPAAASQAN